MRLFLCLNGLSKSLSDQYCQEKVLGWKGELKALSKIGRSQPHAAYTVFMNGYKSKFTYFIRIIESFEDYVDSIQEAIDDFPLLTLFGQTEPHPSDLCQLVTLTPAKGGLGVPDLWFEAPQQFAVSITITASHVYSITHRACSWWEARSPRRSQKDNVKL